MTQIAPWDIVVALTILGLLALVFYAWRKMPNRRWVIKWMLAIATPVIVELWAQFDADPSTFTFSEGLTRSFSLPQLWIGGLVLFIVLQIHWPDLVRRGYGKVTENIFVNPGSVWRGVRAMKRPFMGNVPTWSIQRKRGFWIHLWTPIWHNGRGPYVSIGLWFFAVYRGY